MNGQLIRLSTSLYTSNTFRRERENCITYWAWSRAAREVVAEVSVALSLQPFQLTDLVQKLKKLTLNYYTT